MDEEEAGGAEQYELPVSVGEKLRLAREEKGWTLAQVAAETRITQRHLTLIEASDFAALPGRTYSVGFSRTYAKMLGLDENAIAQEVRGELAQIAPRDTRSLTFEPGDPARVPSIRLAWFAALAALILFIGGGAFLWSTFISPEGSLPWLTGSEAPKPKPSAAPLPSAPNPSGAVVFTALDQGIWVKFADGDGRQLMQGEMLQGESYIVPADVPGAVVSTARPTALAITVGGKPVAKLADADKLISDIPVSAAALLARPPAGTAPTSAAPSARRITGPSAPRSSRPEPALAPAEPPAPAVSPTA